MTTEIAPADKLGQEIPTAFDEADSPSRVFFTAIEHYRAVMEATLSKWW